MAKAKTTAKKKRARKERSDTKLTEELIEKAAKIVGQGNFRYVARGRLGIPEGTWISWLHRGKREWREYERGERDEITLKMKLERALDRAECVVHSAIIEDVLASDNHKLRMEYLYRRYGKLYSKNPNAVDDDTGEEYKVDPNQVLNERLGAFLPKDSDG
jgi:hypothetical protein